MLFKSRRAIRVQELTKTFDEKIQQSLSRAKDISERQFTKEYDILWHDEINFLAETMEQKYISMDQQWAIENISQEITRMYNERDIKMGPHVHKYLPEKFKNDYHHFSNTAAVAAVEQFTSGFGHFRNLLEQLQKVKKSGIGEIPSDLVSDFEYTYRTSAELLEKRAGIEHIALFSKADKDKQDSEPTTIDHPRPHGSKSRDAIARCIEVFKDIHDRFFDFPPEILEKDDEIAEGFDTIPKLFKPGLDLKYSKNWVDWWQAEKYRDIYGKHAAGVMSFSVTNLCANCSNENTREWVRMEPMTLKAFDTYSCFQCGYKLETVCPSCNLSMKLEDKTVIGWQCGECGSNIPMRRDLTREQIGDKTSIVMDAAIEFMDHIPFLMSFCSWFRDWIDPYVAGRKKRLSGPLSDRA